MLRNETRYENLLPLGSAKSLSFIKDQPSRLTKGRAALDYGLVIDTDIFTKKSGGTNQMYFLVLT